MFESENEKDTQKARARAILIIGAAATVVLAILVILMVRSRPQNLTELDNAFRAGSPEFDSYRDKITLEIIDKIEHPNMVGMSQYEIRARLSNNGDRPITGVEISGKLLSMDDRIIKENLSMPIPRARKEPLNPGESMRVSVKIDRPGNLTDADIKDLLIELRALRF